MKKILTLLVLFGGLGLSVQAQQVKKTGDVGGTSLVSSEKINAIRSCPELHKQLVSNFGANFSLDDPQVQSLLERNINDQNASVCIRKVSLHAVYGDDYTKHLNRIEASKN